MPDDRSSATHAWPGLPAVSTREWYATYRFLPVDFLGDGSDPHYEQRPGSEMPQRTSVAAIEFEEHYRKPPIGQVIDPEHVVIFGVAYRVAGTYGEFTLYLQLEREDA